MKTTVVDAVRVPAASKKTRKPVRIGNGAPAHKQMKKVEGDIPENPSSPSPPQQGGKTLR